MKSLIARHPRCHSSVWKLTVIPPINLYYVTLLFLFEMTQAEEMTNLAWLLHEIVHEVVAYYQILVKPSPRSDNEMNKSESVKYIEAAAIALEIEDITKWNNTELQLESEAVMMTRLHQFTDRNHVVQREKVVESIRLWTQSWDIDVWNGCRARDGIARYATVIASGPETAALSLRNQLSRKANEKSPIKQFCDIIYGTGEEKGMIRGCREVNTENW